MTGIHHDGYGLRDLTFQLSLMVLGVKQFIRNERYYESNRVLYENYLGDFQHKFWPLLLSTAAHFRALDTLIKKHSEYVEVLQKNCRHHCMAITMPDGHDLVLRDVANKLIHADTYYWYDEATPEIDAIAERFQADHHEDILVLAGDFRGDSWLVAINLVRFVEELYDYSEVVCEHCGL